MNIKSEILKILNTPTHYYKGIPINVLSLPVFNSSNQRSVKNAFYSLNKNGYIQKSENNFLLTEKGKNYIKNRKTLDKFGTTVEKNSPKNLLVLYDIPEQKKKEREWFRWHLKKFHFIMIQRSVWVGPAPLPEEFLEYIKSISLKETIKTFKLAKGYVKN